MPMAQMLSNSQKVLGDVTECIFVAICTSFRAILYLLINLSHAWNGSCDPVENGEDINKKLQALKICWRFIRKL